MRIEVSRIIWYSAEGIIVWIPPFITGAIVNASEIDPKGSLALILLIIGLLSSWYCMQRLVVPAYWLIVYLYGLGWVWIIKGCVAALMA